MAGDPASTARAYYRSLDDGEYEALGELLAEGFVHERPDRTLRGAERFVEFMRSERPRTDTSHPIDAVYRPSGESQESEVAVRGRLLTAEGERITRFVDVFTLDGGRIHAIRTFTD